MSLSVFILLSSVITLFPGKLSLRKMWHHELQDCFAGVGAAGKAGLPPGSASAALTGALAPALQPVPGSPPVVIVKRMQGPALVAPE